MNSGLWFFPVIKRVNSMKYWKAAAASATLTPMLEIEHLSLSIPSADGPKTAVSDVTLTLEPGRVLGLVGESGCGKSITAQTILRLGEHQGIERTGGCVKLDGQDVFAMQERELRALRGGKVSMIFQ